MSKQFRTLGVGTVGSADAGRCACAQCRTSDITTAASPNETIPVPPSSTLDAAIREQVSQRDKPVASDRARVDEYFDKNRPAVPTE